MHMDLGFEEDCGFEEVIEALESLKGIKIRGGNDISKFSIHSDSDMERLSEKDKPNVIDAVNLVIAFLNCSAEEDSKQGFSYQKGCKKLTQSGFETSYGEDQDGYLVGSVRIGDQKYSLDERPHPSDQV